MGTERPPSGGSTVGLARAGAFLAARYGREASAVTAVGRGEWSKAYTFRRAGVDYVIRFSPVADDFAKDRLAAAYGSDELPIPRVIEVGQALDGFYAVSEKARGSFLDELGAAEMRRVLPGLFAVLDAARRVDLASSAGYGLWGPDGNAPHPSWREALLDVANDRPTDRTHGWRERLAASPTGPGPFEEAFARLEALAEHAPDERRLIHSDLLHDNVLVSGGRISAVLDWGCSMYGDFLYDLAWLCFWAPWYPAWRDIDFQDEAARHHESLGLDVPRFEERLRCCQVHIGLAAQAYCAYVGRWADLEATARQTLSVAAEAG